ncbi:MAG: ATP-binding cassette domain-containing protein [Desulfovibrio sp.]|nr:ATP-binding cassette domain-containing protein [Desulfovibrio sp.]
MAPIIIAKDLYKCYPGFSPVLRGVNIEVQPGEAVAIMGPSGCGKSTMLHILGMLHAPDSGSLNILDTDVLKLTGEQIAAFRRSNMGFVMQANNLFEHSTVFENVEFPLIYENVPPSERWARVIRALELVRLSGRVHYRSNRLSGGEQQRVAIARAMVNNPRVLLADEPTGALDANTSRLIMENFRRLCHTGGVALVMVTHDPKMAEYCDSVYTLEDGVLRCQKHEPVPYKASADANLLNPPDPLSRGALVAARFPNPDNPSLLDLARGLNENLLLSQIYASKKAGLLGAPAGYSLSLPIRGMGRWEKILACFSLLRHARSSADLWQIWRELPGRASLGRNYFDRMKIFAAAGLMARWGLADKVQFMFACGARRPATLAFIAARLLKINFAWLARGRDFARFNDSWKLKARAASFVICTSQSIRRELLARMPDVAPDKIYLFRPPLTVASADDETERLPVQKGKPLDILAMGARISKTGFRLALDACSRLKRRGIPCRLTIIGERDLSSRWLIRRAGLRKDASFSGRPTQDSLSAAFGNADIFIAYPPAGVGGELETPSYLCEAMAFGLDIVSVPLTPGFAEILKDKSNALVAGDANPETMANLIAGLSGNEELRQSLGENARKDIRALINADEEWNLIADLIIEASAPANRKVDGR